MSLTFFNRNITFKCLYTRTDEPKELRYLLPPCGFTPPIEDHTPEAMTATRNLTKQHHLMHGYAIQNVCAKNVRTQ